MESNLGLYAHANFYFLKRSIMLRMGQEIAFATNPFDLQDNFKNNAYGSRFLSSTYLQLNYKRENIYKRIGIQAGVLLLHYSNANFRAPNSSLNTFNLHLGVNYNLSTQEEPGYSDNANDLSTGDNIRLNLVFRTGLNLSDNLNFEQHPFADFSDIILESDLSLVNKQGDTQRLVVESHTNLIDDICLKVVDQNLDASFTLNCIPFRD